MLTDEEILLRTTVRDFAEKQLKPNASALDQNEEFPSENIRGLSELGLFGLTVDERYGGNGGTTRQLALTIEEIARGCGSTSVVYIAHLSLCTHFIEQFGTEEQKKKYIPDLARAEKIGAFALTEQGAGSDAAAISLRAKRHDSFYELNGTKLFTTNALEAETFVVLATLDPSAGTRGIIALVVTRDVEGFQINPQHGKMGMRATSTAEMLFDNCLLPVGNRLGGEGTAFGMTMRILDGSRVAVAAQCVGIAQAAYEASVDYVQQRHAFGQELSKFQSVQWTIADMATNIEAARLLTMHAATMKDRNLGYSREASMAKLFASRVAVEAADKAVQIHGGSGYFAPTVVERLYRDAKLTEIYEGTSEVQRMVISKSLLE